MKIKIIEYKEHQGNKAKIKSVKLRKGKYIENPAFDFQKKMYYLNPIRFIYFKEYETDI